MTNVMDIGGYRAVVSYDPDIEMLRGEFVDLNGGADFYASDLDGLREEGQRSLKVFLDMCAEDHVEPRKRYDGEIGLHLPPDVHAEIVALARARGTSVDAWVAEAINRQMTEHR